MIDRMRIKLGCVELEREVTRTGRVAAIYGGDAKKRTCGGELA